jgi:glycogen synthase
MRGGSGIGRPLFVFCPDLAIGTGGDQDLWRGLQRRGMQRDYSWRAPAQAYGALYQEMVGSIVPFEPT